MPVSNKKYREMERSRDCFEQLAQEKGEKLAAAQTRNAQLQRDNGELVKNGARLADDLRNERANVEWWEGLAAEAGDACEAASLRIDAQREAIAKLEAEIAELKKVPEILGYELKFTNGSARRILGPNRAYCEEGEVPFVVRLWHEQQAVEYGDEKAHGIFCNVESVEPIRAKAVPPKASAKKKRGK